MQLKTLWSIILKTIGIWFAFAAVQLVFFIFAVSDFSKDMGVPAVVSLLIQAGLAFICLFRTDYLIGLFKLEESIPQKEITTNIETKNVLRLAIAIIGILSLSDSIPELIGILTGRPSGSMVLLGVFKVLLGIVMVGRNYDIEAFIAKYQRK